MSEPRPEKVTILGKTYTVGCTAEEVEALHASARLLDERMREIRDSGKIIGSDRIAVIAALNIAHELLQERTREREQTRNLRARIDGMQNRIGEVLGEDGDPQLKL